MTGQPGGAINETFFSEYDATVQSALSSGSGVYVIVAVVRDWTCVRLRVFIG